MLKIFIECGLSFCTTSPRLSCAGKMVLLPIKTDKSLTWKIWVLSTWVDHIIQHPEDETLLLSAGRTDLVDSKLIETDVLIIGAGSSLVRYSAVYDCCQQLLTIRRGLMTAARLKALGVESVIADRSDRVGDSWALRYDCLRFHVPTSNCEMPYPRELSHSLTMYSSRIDKSWGSRLQKGATKPTPSHQARCSRTSAAIH